MCFSRPGPPGPRVCASASRRSLRDQFSAFHARAIRWLLATTLVSFTSVYLFYTYVATVYAQLACNRVFLAVIFGTIGISGTIGKLLASRLSDRFRPLATVIAALILIALVAVPAALSAKRVLTIATTAVYGQAVFAITGLQQHHGVRHRGLSSSAERGAAATTYVGCRSRQERHSALMPSHCFSCIFLP